MLALGFGFAAGFFAAKLDTGKIDRALASGCASDCYQYVTKHGQIYGLLIAQNSESTIVVTRSGTYLLDTKDVEYVKPVRGTRKKLHEMAIFSWPG